jgi:hypothetical protein
MFVKGQSGNPAGRKKIPPEEQANWEALAKKGPTVLETLLTDPECPHNVRVKIIEIATDRAWGKPVQAVEADITERRPIVIDSAYGETSEKN